MGAQTQRSSENFRIGTETMPKEIIRAFAILKKSAAIVNGKLGKLDADKVDAITTAPTRLWPASGMSTFRWWFGRPAAARSQYERERSHCESGQSVA